MNDNDRICNEILPFHVFLRYLDQCEKTRRRWANPLSIYAPDPISMEVVSFNASLRESIREQQTAIDKFRIHIENIRKELYS